MSFTVIWRPTAQQRLARLWIDSSDRQAVTAAANDIDRFLKHDPLHHGESRFGSTRLLIHRPLAVYYDVSEDDRIVTVWAVWHLP
jgi:plasmid stabilization system protein ParE